MERDILQCNLPNILIYRPSLIYGNRNDKRIGEAIGIWLVKILQYAMIGKFKKYRAISGEDLAKALFIGVSRTGHSCIYDLTKVESF